MTAGILLLGAAIFGSVAIIEIVTRRTDVGAALVLGLVLVDELTRSFDASAYLGSFRVGPADLLFGVLFASAIARLLRTEKLSTPQRLLAAIWILTVWSVGRGAATIAVTTAVNEARSFLLFLAAVLYFSTAEPREGLYDTIGRLWLIAASLLSVIALVRWGAAAAGSATGVLAPSGSDSLMRVLGSHETLYLGFAAVIALPLMDAKNRLALRLLTPVFLVFVLLLQHRSVWIATAVGLSFSLLSSGKTARRAAPLLAGLVVLGVTLSALFAPWENSLGTDLSTAAQTSGTWDWRVEGWVALVDDAPSARSIEGAVGRPFGSGWTRALSAGRVVEVSPHNFYIAVLFRTGAVGLTLMIALYALSARRTHVAARDEQNNRGPLSPSLLRTILVMQLVYFIPYGENIGIALLFGLACTSAADLPSRSRMALVSDKA